MIYAPAITSIKCLIGTYVLHVYIIAQTYVRVKPHLLLLHDFPYPLLLLGLPYNIMWKIS